MTIATLRLVSVAILSLLPVCAQADEWNKRWDVGPKPTLRVHAGDAAVVIEGTDRTAIEAHVTTRGWTIGRNDVQISEHQSGDTVDIDIRVPSRMFSMGDRSIRLELRVPRALAGEIHTGDGSIHLSRVGGALRVDTGDGSIRGEDLDGVLEARTGDGSVHVAGRFDQLQLHTHDGSVELSANAGSRLETPWHLETGDGSVRLHVPSDLKANLELRTGDGHISMDVPGSSTQRRADHELIGRLNGGGPAMLVKTGDGSITVTSSAR